MTILLLRLVKQGTLSSLNGRDCRLEAATKQFFI